MPGAPPVAAAPSIPAVTSQSPPAPLDPTLVAKLEPRSTKASPNAGVPGVIVGVWIPGYGEWVSQRGVADLATDAPMARGNQQAIGSITKTFIGIVALQVIEDGRYDLSLDSTIDRWYPEIPEASKITVRMLLNMSSGVGNSPQGQVDRICADPYATPTPDEVIAANMAYPRARTRCTCSGRRHDEAGLQRRDDLVLQPIGEVGGVEQAERRRVELVAGLRFVDRLGEERRARPARVADA